MKVIKIKHVSGPAQAIISMWHRYTTKIDDVIDVNEIECETLLSKTFNDMPVFELVKQSKEATPKPESGQEEKALEPEPEQMQEKQPQEEIESVEG